MKPAIVNQSPSRSILAAALLALAPFATPAPASMSSGFDRLLDSVVRIDVRELNFEDGARRIDAGIGSGSSCPRTA